MSINELLERLPLRLRFAPTSAEQAAYAQAIGRGWTVEQIAEYVEQGTQGAHQPGGLAVHRLRTCAGTPPPRPERPTNVGARPPMGKPECANCGQPYGRRGYRPPLGPYDKDCVDCGQPLVLVDPPERDGGAR